MNLTTLKVRLIKKPPMLVLPHLFFFLLLIFLKWHINLPLDALYFLLGAVLGIYLLDIAEEFFELNPSPFRTAVFSLGLLIVGFYIVTSTREVLAQGLVLSLNLTLFLFAFSEWKIKQNLDSWFTTLVNVTDRSVQVVGLFLFGIGLLVLSTLFLLG